jgi:aspartate/methionine/tyrosine aminotransferase
MSGSRAPYMEWAKTRPRAEVDLAGSNLLPCTLEDLPGAREAVDIEGESPEGYPPLVEAIARHHGVSADRIATAGGCSGASFLTCAAILSPGDHVLVEAPGYDPLPAAAALLGARVSVFERRFEEGYALDPDAVAAALTPDTRLVMLSNPHNPSGAVASPESLARLANLAEALGFHVLVDEVYRDTVLEDRPEPAALRSDHLISTSSLTKAYGLASLRCGWAIASPELANAIRRARDVVDVWSPMPADRISVVAFRHIDRLAARARTVIEANRAAVARFLEGQPALRAVPSRSTLVFPRLQGTDDAGPFVERLFRDTGTAVAPGRFFGAPAHFRVAFGGDPAALRRGLASIERCLDASGAPGSP